jgi:hypothetical protein
MKGQGHITQYYVPGPQDETPEGGMKESAIAFSISTERGRNGTGQKGKRHNYFCSKPEMGIKESSIINFS